jgi:hypothetical protein
MRNAIVSAMLLPLLLILGLHAQTAPYVDPVNRGSELLRICRYVTMPEARDDHNAIASDYRAAAGCTSYISGFTDGTSESDSTRKPYCVTHATTRELVRVYVIFMQENPQWLDYHMSVGLTLALEDAYPCPVADPNQSPEEDPDPDPDSAK